MTGASPDGEVARRLNERRQMNISNTNWCPHLSNLFAAYLAKGFMDKGGLSLEEDNAEAGEEAAIARVTSYASMLCMVHGVAAYFEYEHPGVFCYEVVEPLGVWLRNQPDASHDALIDQTMVILKTFFGHDCLELHWALLNAHTPSSIQANSISFSMGPQRRLTALYYGQGQMTGRDSYPLANLPTVILIGSSDHQASRALKRLSASTVARISSIVPFEAMPCFELPKANAKCLADWAKRLLDAANKRQSLPACA